VLDYSKIERGIQQYKFTPTQIVDTVKNIIHSMEYQFKINKFTIETKFHQDEIIIHADEDAVSEALVNLLSNALKYSTTKKQINVIVDQKEEYVVIEVKDWGKGILPEDLKNIFKPFFRAKDLEIDRTGGAGLGLAIVKHIMDAHKGKVEVESTPEIGSKFTLLFPIGNIDD
jgi:two-component system phosphate regulon sensor histidine kinase PhoR